MRVAERVKDIDCCLCFRTILAPFGVTKFTPIDLDAPAQQKAEKESHIIANGINYAIHNWMSTFPARDPEKLQWPVDFSPAQLTTVGNYVKKYVEQHLGMWLTGPQFVYFANGFRTTRFETDLVRG